MLRPHRSTSGILHINVINCKTLKLSTAIESQWDQWCPKGNFLWVPTPTHVLSLRIKSALAALHKVQWTRQGLLGDINIICASNCSGLWLFPRLNIVVKAHRVLRIIDFVPYLGTKKLWPCPSTFLGAACEQPKSANEKYSFNSESSSEWQNFRDATSIRFFSHIALQRSVPNVEEQIGLLLCLMASQMLLHNQGWLKWVHSQILPHTSYSTSISVCITNPNAQKCMHKHKCASHRLHPSAPGKHHFL